MNNNENPATSRTQVQQILDYLLSGGKITPLEALEKFGSFRLGARIADIKEMGYEIESKFISTPTQKKVKQYWLKQAE